MDTAYHEEACACGATLKTPANLGTWHKVVEAWRSGHRHEFPPAGDMYVESGSSHERDPGTQPLNGETPRIGFQRA